MESECSVCCKQYNTCYSSSERQETKEFHSLDHVRELFLAPSKCVVQFSKCTGESKLSLLSKVFAEKTKELGSP